MMGFRQKIREHWEAVYEHMFGQYVRLLKENRRLKEEDTIYFDDSWWGDIEQPTQRDKPTAHSSLSRATLLAKLKRGFYESKFKTYTVSNTNSMEPFIDDNCIVVMEFLSAEDFESDPITEGDVCVWATVRNGRPLLIIHRILEIRTRNGERQFYFRGDNNFIPDGWVPQDLVQSRLVAVAYGQPMRDGD